MLNLTDASNFSAVKVKKTLDKLLKLMYTVKKAKGCEGNKRRLLKRREPAVGVSRRLSGVYNSSRSCLTEII